MEAFLPKMCNLNLIVKKSPDECKVRAAYKVPRLSFSKGRYCERLKKKKRRRNCSKLEETQET